MLKSHMQNQPRPHAKHPVERMVEDIVRSANRNLSDEEQTEIYNDLIISLFETMGNRTLRGSQPVRISEGNKVWKNYRNIYLPQDEIFQEHFEHACKGMVNLYTGKIPGNYGKG